MPTGTFFNLPPEKRGRIMDAATEEFSRVPFSQASINQIVKTAGISRGSFYQYFKDKEDLFRYLLELISAEKLKVYAQAKPGTTYGGVFGPLFERMPAIFQWAKSQPLYYRIGLLLTTEEPELERKIFQHNGVGVDWFLHYLKSAQDEGKIRPEVDLHMVVGVLRGYVTNLVEGYYASEDQEASIRHLHAFFDLLEHGIAPKGGDTIE